MKITVEFDLEMITDYEKETLDLIEWATGEIMKRINADKDITGSEEGELKVYALSKEIIYKAAHNRKYIIECDGDMDKLTKKEKEELQSLLSHQLLTEKAIKNLHAQLTSDKQGIPYVPNQRTFNA